MRRQLFLRLLPLRRSALFLIGPPEATGQDDLYGVQKVGSKIYKASYPIRSFGRRKIEGILAPNYAKLLEWECELQPDPQTVSKGYLFGRSDLI
jgi:hypothetical protein